MSAALLPLSLMLACNGKPADTSDDGGDDTGPTVSADGCYIVDETAGFDALSEALEYADEGSSVTLCAGEITGSFVINKSVSLVGAGAGEVTWVADSAQPAVKVSGAESVTLSGFTVSSDRAGVHVENSTGVTLSDLVFESGMASSAIRVTDSDDVDISAVTVDGAGGGIEVVGGSASIADSTVTDTLGFGILADSGAVVTASRNTISGIEYTELVDGGLADGFDIMAREGAQLTTVENVLTPTYVGVWGPEADVWMDGDTITGGFYGIYQYLGELGLSGVTIDQPTYVGLITQTQDPVSIVDSSIAMAGEAGDETAEGAEIYANEVTLDGFSVSGTNFIGLYLSPFDSELALTASDVTVSDAGCLGLLAAYATGSFENLTLEDHRAAHTTTCIDAGFGFDSDYDGVDDMAQQYGMEFDYSDVTWTGGGVLGTEGYGVISYQSDLAIADATFSDAVPFYEGYSGVNIFNLYGNLSIDGSTFSNNRYSLYNSSGSLELTNSTFTDNRVSYVATDGSYASHASSTDLYSSTTGTVNVSGTTFENGSYGLSLYGGTGNLSNNSWSGYRQNAIVVGSSGAYGVVDNSISDSGSYLLYCSSGTMQGSGIDIVNSGTYTYSTTYYLPDGKEDYTDEYTSYGYGMYLYDCDAELEDVSVTDAWYSQAYVLYGNVELDGVTFSSHEKASTWASGDLYAYGSSSDELQLSNVSVEANDLSYYALYVGGYTATVDTATVSGASYGAYFSGLTSPTVSGLTVTGASSAGVYVSSVTDGAFTDVDSSGNAGRGMYVSSGTATFDGTTTLDDNGSEGLYTYLGTVAIGAGSVSGNGTNGLSPSATTLSLTGTSVTDNSVYGMYTTSGATVSLDGVTVSGSGSDGIYAQSSTLIAVDSASTDNGGYGLLCDGSSWSGDLDLGGNASGESWGCDGDDDDTGI